jgi:hypothetical protein
MKVLIAILSCHALRHYEQAQRDTWIKDIPEGVDHRFFLGRSTTEQGADEVFLSTGDAFSDITEKAVAVFRWALEQGYDFVFKADLDTLVRPMALLASGFEQHDYSGGQNSFFASGGSGYWLSRRAMQYVVARPVVPGPTEDVHVGQAVRDNGLELHSDLRYKFFPGSTLDEHTLTYHLSSVVNWSEKYKVEWMYEAYRSLGSYRPLKVTPEIRFRRLRCP